jgi:hypothetical protein
LVVATRFVDEDPDVVRLGHAGAAELIQHLGANFIFTRRQSLDQPYRSFYG